MLNFYCNTKGKKSVRVGDKVAGHVQTNNSKASIRRKGLYLILCLVFIFSTSGVLVPRAVQAEEGGYLLDRVVEWGDGTTEHIQIGDDGFFRLDGVKRCLVGIDIGIDMSHEGSGWRSSENHP